MKREERNKMRKKTRDVGKTFSKRCALHLTLFFNCCITLACMSFCVSLLTWVTFLRKVGKSWLKENNVSWVETHSYPSFHPNPPPPPYEFLHGVLDHNSHGFKKSLSGKQNLVFSHFKKWQTMSFFLQGQKEIERHRYRNLKRETFHLCMGQLRDMGYQEGAWMLLCCFSACIPSSPSLAVGW